MPKPRDASGQFISNDKADEIIEAEKRIAEAKQNAQQQTFDKANKLVDDYYAKVEAGEKITDELKQQYFDAIKDIDKFQKKSQKEIEEKAEEYAEYRVSQVKQLGVHETELSSIAIGAIEAAQFAYKKGNDDMAKGFDKITELTLEQAAASKQIGSEDYTNLTYKTEIAATDKEIYTIESDILKAKAAGRSDDMQDLISKKQALQLQKDGLEKLEESAEIMNYKHDAITKGLQPLKDMEKKFNDILHTVGAIVSNPMVLLVTLITAAAAHFAATEKAAEDFRQGLGLTVSESKALEESAMNVTKNMAAVGQTYTESLSAASALVTTMGSLSAATAENIEMVSKMSKVLGVTADESAKFLENMSATAGITVKEAGHLAVVSTELAKAAGVAPGQVIKDMTTNSESFANYIKDGGENLAEAAVFAAKMGVNIASMVKMADSLLNIEQSLNDEMEAEALLGRDINLEKARQLAFDGKIAEMGAEITKQVGTAAEWESMRGHERAALAKAMGMEVSEMGKMIKNQELIADLEAGRLSTQEAIAQGLSFDEVMKVNDVLGPITEMKNSISAIAMNLLEVFKPVFSAIALIIEGIAFTLALIAKWLNTDIGKGLTAGVVALTLWRSNTLGMVKNLTVGGLKAIKNFVTWLITGQKAQEATTKSAKGMFSVMKDGMKSITGKGKSMLGLGKAKVSDSVKTTESPTESPTGGMFKNFDAKKALKGAAALLVVSTALFVFAKALQEMPLDVGPYIAAAAGLGIMGAALFGISKLSGDLIVGAAAMVIMGASLIPFAFGLQMLSDVDYGQIALVGVTLIAFTAAVFGLGVLMMTGVGALIFGAGVAGFIALGGALIVLGVGVTAIGGGMMLLTMGLQGLGEHIIPLATNVSNIVLLAGAFALFGISLVSLAAGLALIAPMLPVILALGAIGGLAMGVMSFTTSNEHSEGETSSSTSSTSPSEGENLGAKLDRLISLVEQGGVINMDGKKVGEVLGGSIMRPVVG